ncbi:hypothetical protein [Thalassospira marina]|uniref:hypothetical protein n=1 Tax=Thalassospira marina TaxID=2048283 RepID=UPI0012FEBB65|nr:hypothetical protein [Thalassospira marina]
MIMIIMIITSHRLRGGLGGKQIPEHFDLAFSIAKTEFSAVRFFFTEWRLF